MLFRTVTRFEDSESATNLIGAVEDVCGANFVGVGYGKAYNGDGDPLNGAAMITTFKTSLIKFIKFYVLLHKICDDDVTWDLGVCKGIISLTKRDLS